MEGLLRKEILLCYLEKSRGALATPVSPVPLPLPFEAATAVTTDETWRDARTVKFSGD